MSEASIPDRLGYAPPARREHVPLAIVYMIGATIVFAASSAASKWLVASYPVGEVLFTRTAVALIIMSLFILPQTGLAVFRTRRLGQHVMRSVSQAFSQTFLLIAFSLMPLAAASAINFSAPLFATLVSALLLKEAVGLTRWSVLLVGFLGVLIVTSPGAETFQIGALFALGNAVLYGSVTAAVRGMTATESAETLTLYQLALLTGIFALFLPFGWVTPTPADAGWILFNGVANAIGQYWWTRSHPPRAGLGGHAVLLFLAGVGEHPGIRDLGRGADHEPGDRLGHRGRLRPVPALARDRSRGRRLPNRRANSARKSLCSAVPARRTPSLTTRENRWRS